METDSIDLLLLTPGFPANESDSTCIPFLQDLVKGLQARPEIRKIRIISFQYPFTRVVYTWNDIEVYSAGGKNKKGLARLLTWRRVTRQAKRWWTDKTVVHSFWLTEAALLGSKLAAKNSCRHIATVMGQDVLLSNRYLQQLAVKDIQVVVPNEISAGYYRMHTAYEPAAIIPHSIAPVQVEQVERDIDLLFVGSFIELKQPHLFVEAVQELHRRRPGLKAFMVGKGALLAAMRKQIEDEKLPITCTGELPRNEVFSLLQRCKVLLHTSRFEGHSTVISEALVHGCRVVCANIGRPENTTYILVAPDTKSFARLAQEALDAPELPAVTHTGYEQMLEAYIHLYQEKRL